MWLGFLVRKLAIYQRSFFLVVFISSFRIFASYYTITPANRKPHSIGIVFILPHAQLRHTSVWQGWRQQGLWYSVPHHVQRMRGPILWETGWQLWFVSRNTWMAWSDPLYLHNLELMAGKVMTIFRLNLPSLSCCAKTKYNSRNFRGVLDNI